MANVAYQGLDELCPLILLAALPLVWMQDRPMKFGVLQYLMFALSAWLFVSGLVNASFATEPYIYNFMAWQSPDGSDILSKLFGPLIFEHVQGGYGLGYSVSNAGFWLIMAALTARKHSKAEIKAVIYSYMTIAVILTLALLASNYNILEWSNTSRGDIPFLFFSLNANLISYWMVPMILIAYVRLWVSLRWKDIVMLVIGLLAQLLCRSRGALLGLVVGFIILTVYFLVTLKNKKTRLIKMGAIAALFVIGTLTIKFVLPDLWSGLFRFENWLSGSGRTTIWKECIGYLDSPSHYIFGRGWGYYYYLHQGNMVAWYGMHNLFVQYFVNSGITAVALVIAVVVWMALRVRNWAIWGMMAPLYVYMMVENGLMFTNMIFIFLFLAGADCESRKQNAALEVYMDTARKTEIKKRIKPEREIRWLEVLRAY